MLLAMQAQILPQQIQKTILAPVMQQSIEVLLLTVTELNCSIEQELQDNPLLEMNEEVPPLPGTKFEKVPRSPDDEVVEEIPVKIEPSLEENLLRQLRVEPLSPLESRIGEYFIGNLDEDGYLKTTCDEAALALGIDDPALIEGVLKTIQGFDPPGIASRNLKECLLFQAGASLHPCRDTAMRIIEDHLQDLGCKRFVRIAKDTGLPPAQIREAANFITTLEPRPARNSRPIRSSIYIQPDVFIRRDENGYHVEVSREGIPSLRVNAYYKNLLVRPDLSDRDREFIQERFRRAANFIKSIEQRGYTLRRIAEYILMKQTAFFERGEDLVPMVLKDVARALGRNESTISRAVSSKFIETPAGIFPLKFFFSQGILSTADETRTPRGFVASRSVKEEIQQIITREDKSAPLSDQDIHRLFRRRHMQIARRTISKYRQSLNILPSNLRKI